MTAVTSLRQRTVHSLAWQVLGTGGQRVVQFLGLAAIARLMVDAKDDIGLFGIVLAGIASIEALTAFTGEQSQIHSRRGGERAFLDTVFTVRLIRGIAVALILAALAPAFAWFFAKPEHQDRYWLTGLFLALSVNGLGEAIQSPARAARMKELDFRRVAIGDLGAALFGTALQVALVYAWRDVWALLVGQLAATLLRSIASYIVAPYRPRLAIDRPALKELMRYTLGGAGTPFLLMMIMQAPALVLGKLYPEALFAIYAYCDRLSKLPEELCLRVLAPVAIPAYAKLHGEPERLAGAWLKAIRGILLLGVPGTVTLFWIGNDLPAVAFGKDFGSVDWLFPMLAIRGGIAGTNSVIGPLFWAIGEPQKDRTVQLVRMILLYALGIPMAIRFGASGFAVSAAFAVAVALALSLRFALHRLRLPLRALGGAATAGLVHGLALIALLTTSDWLLAPTGVMRLVVGGCIGAAVLGAAVLRSGLMRQS